MACSKSNNKVSVIPINSSLGCVTIDIDSAKSVESFLCSSILEPPRTIILESNDKCVIKEIHTIDVYDDKIYILDDASNKLHVFNIDGSFLYNIGHRGKGRGEYTELSDFCIDRENGYIYLWDPVMTTALKYNISSREYIASIKIDIGGYDSSSLMYYNKKIYVNRTSVDIDNDNYLVSEIEESTGQETAKYLNAKEYNHGWNFPLRLQYGNFMSRNSSSPKFLELFTDTIVSFTADGIKPAYAIKSSHFVSDDDVNRFIEKCKDNRNYNIFDLDKDLIFMPICFLEMGDYVSFGMISKGNISYFLYNTQTKETLKSDSFTNDYVSSQCYIAANLLYSDENGAISVLKSDFIPCFVEEVVPNGLLNRSIDKYDELVCLKETSNPVLFYHQYKKSK